MTSGPKASKPMHWRHAGSGPYVLAESLIALRGQIDQLRAGSRQIRRPPQVARIGGYSRDPTSGARTFNETCGTPRPNPPGHRQQHHGFLTLAPGSRVVPDHYD